MNYWTKKTKDLQDIMNERDIIVDDEDTNSRKFIINLLKLDDLDKGNTQSVMVLNDENELVELTSDTSAPPVDSQEKPDEQPVAKKIDPNDPYRGLLMMRCTFRHRTESEPGYVSLGLNGKQFYIPKDVEVVVPAFLKAVIDTAIEDKMETITGPMGSVEQKMTRVPRIAWEFHEYVNQERGEIWPY